MKIREAIILAGGLGTRLSAVLPDLPKCMASVNGKPFIAYVIDHLQKQGIEKLIFSLGYKHEMITQYLNSFQEKLRTQNSPITIHYSIEEEQLGTGGAIKLACSVVNEKNVLIVNGDTLFKVDVRKLFSFHLSNNAQCTLSLKPMKEFERYDVVELNHDSSIKDFKEKKYYHEGLINGGMYMLDVSKFLEEALPAKFSFEKDYLEKFYNHRRMYGVVQDEYFIDIGIPEDYARAQIELRNEFDF
jgi:D-glycero-alpha-D-manno-heptose 1-phosphate guanylyltransferase